MEKFQTPVLLSLNLIRVIKSFIMVITITYSYVSSAGASPTIASQGLKTSDGGVQASPT